MSAEEELYGLACQDMPVSGDEVREAMNAWAHELAEKIRGSKVPNPLGEVEEHVNHVLDDLANEFEGRRST